MKSRAQLAVLLVEDNEFDAQKLLRLAATSERFNMSITRVVDLDSALAQLNETPFELIISALDLPDSQGPETVRRLIAAAPAIPLIVMTVNREESLIEDTYIAGAQDFIVKGLTDLAPLERSIQQTLERHRIKREHQNAIAELENVNRRYTETLEKLDRINNLFAGEIEPRRPAQRLVKESEDGLKLAQSIAKLGSWELDLVQQRYTMSHEMQHILGLPDALDSQAIFAWLMDHVHPEDRLVVEQSIADLQSAGTFSPHEYRIQARDGEIHWIVSSRPTAVRTDSNGKPMILRGIVQDITARKSAEEKAARLICLYRTLSETNEAIARTDDDTRMLQSVCEIALRMGGFNLAWIGMHDEECDTLRAVAGAGGHATITKEVVLSLDPAVTSGQSLACDAYRARVPLFCNHNQSDDRRDIIQELLQARGVAASIALPLWQGRDIVGVYNLGSPHQGFFDDEIAGLLKDMAQNISSGLENLRRTRMLRFTLNALSDREAILMRLADTLGKEYFFYRHDPQGILTYISPSVTDMLGYAPVDCYTDFNRFLTESPINSSVDHFTQLSLQGIPQAPYEIEVYHKDGRRILLEVTELPVRDDHGDITAVEGLAHDITRRKQVEVSLRQTQVHLENIFNESEEGICLIDLNYSIQFANDKLASLLNVSREELMSMPCYDAFRCGLSKSRNCCIRQVVAEDKETLQDVDIMVCGTRKPLSVRVKPMRDRKGHIISVMKYVRDVSEYEARHHEKLQKQKLESIGQLAAGIAHEINTPAQYVSDNTVFLKRAYTGLLTVMKVYSSAIDDSENGALSAERRAEIAEAARKAKLDFLTDEVPKALDQSLEGLGRIASIVGAMKEFSHPSDGEKQPIDLKKAIESTILVSRNEWKYVAEVETDFDPALPNVPGLRDELNQVFLNLIINAAHAIAKTMPKQDQEKGRISVHAALVDESVEISFRDDGCGIPSENLSKIFDPFFTTKPVGVGSGQGLAIAHSIIVDKHGGSITVDSELGKGTIILIHLPLEQASTSNKESNLEDSIR